MKPVADAPLGQCPEDPPSLQRAAAGWPLVPLGCLVCFTLWALHLLNNETPILAGFENHLKLFFVSERVSRGLSLLCYRFLGVDHLHLLQLLTILVASAGLCSSVSMFFVYGWAQNWPWCSGCVEQRGRIARPSAGCPVAGPAHWGAWPLFHRALANDAWVNRSILYCCIYLLLSKVFIVYFVIRLASTVIYYIYLCVYLNFSGFM